MASAVYFILLDHIIFHPCTFHPKQNEKTWTCQMTKDTEYPHLHTHKQIKSLQLYR